MLRITTSIESTDNSGQHNCDYCQCDCEGNYPLEAVAIGRVTINHNLIFVCSDHALELADKLRQLSVSLCIAVGRQP